MNLYSNGTIHPHEGQWRAWQSDKRFVVMLAGTQGGKTSFLPWWLAREITLCGPGDYLAITTSYDLFKLKFLPEMRNVFEHTLRIGRWWAGNRVIELCDPQAHFWAKHADDDMWGRIILRSVQGKGALESATAKGAIFDEAGQDEATLEDWEAIIRRLSLAQGRCCIGTTLYNLGWLKSELYDPWARGESNDVEVIQFASVLNPAFPVEEFERVQERMQDWRFQMFYLGQFAMPPSMIYGCVTPEHWVDDFTIPYDWPVVVGVDPSGGHCATLWLAQNPENLDWFAFRETLDYQHTTREHVQKAQGLVLKGQQAEFVGGGPSETQERRDWADHGQFLAKPPVMGVDPGIDRAVGLFKRNRLYLFKSFRMLRDEIGSYRRKTDEQGKVLAKIEDKRKYHLLDCLRAAAVHIAEPAGEVQVGAL